MVATEERKMKARKDIAHEEASKPSSRPNQQPKHTEAKNKALHESNPAHKSRGSDEEAAKREENQQKEQAAKEGAMRKQAVPQNSSADAKVVDKGA